MHVIALALLVIGAASGQDGDAVVGREVKSRLCLATNGAGPLECAALSPCGKYVATSGGGVGLVWLWDAATGELICTLGNQRFGVAWVAFSPDGRYLACTGVRDTTRIWNLKTRKLHREFRPVAEGSGCVLFTPDSKGLVVVDLSGGVAVWSVETGEQTGIVPASSVRCIALSADGKMLVAGSAKGWVELFDARTYERRWGVKAHDGPVSAVACHPTAGVLSGGLRARVVNCWDVRDGKRTREIDLTKQLAWVRGIAITRDGQSAIAVGGSRNAYQVALGKEATITATFVGHLHDLECVAVSADGRTLVTASKDTMARLWELPRAK